MATPQNQALQTTNTLIEAAQMAMQLYNLMSTLDQQWVDIGVANMVAKFSTVVLNADGSLGAADTTPNTANPIDISKYGIERAISSFQLSQIKTVLDGFVGYINGQTVTTQAGARAILAVAVGGTNVTPPPLVTTT